MRQRGQSVHVVVVYAAQLFADLLHIPGETGEVVQDEDENRASGAIHISVYCPIGPWAWRKICSPSCYEHDARVAEEGFVADLVCVFALGIVDEEGCHV